MGGGGQSYPEPAVRIQQAAFDRLGPNRSQRHPGTVVTHFDDDVAALVQQGQANVPHGGLAGVARQRRYADL